MDRIPRLNRQVPIVDRDGTPSNQFQRLWQGFAEASEQIDAVQQEQIDAVTAAQAAADAAQAAADAAEATAGTVGADLTAHVANPDPHPGYVREDQTATWGAPTGTATRTTFATYAAPSISASPTQAEVQALADHVQILSERLAALIDDLQAIGALS